MLAFNRCHVHINADLPRVRHIRHFGCPRLSAFWSEQACDILPRPISRSDINTSLLCVTPPPISGHAANTRSLALAFAGRQTCKEHQSGAQPSDQSNRCPALRQIASTTRNHPRPQHTEATDTSSRSHPSKPVSLVLHRSRQRPTLYVRSWSARRQVRQGLASKISRWRIHQSIDRSCTLCFHTPTELDRRDIGQDSRWLCLGIGKSWWTEVLLTWTGKPGTSCAECLASSQSVHDRRTKGTV